MHVSLRIRCLQNWHRPIKFAYDRPQWLQPKRLVEELENGDWPRPSATVATRLQVRLHGSLAFTGKGHATDRAIILGLVGETPADIDADKIETYLTEVAELKSVGTFSTTYHFDPATDLIFDYDARLPAHTNGMTFSAFDDGGRRVFSKEIYSIGGGFIASAEEIDALAKADPASLNVPFPFSTSEEMLAMAESSGLTIAEMKRRNEYATDAGG